MSAQPDNASSQGPATNGLNKVCLVGANGTLGSVLLPALVNADFQVTILLRATSKSKPAFADRPNVTVTPIDDDFAIPELTEKLRGHDAVVAAFPLPGRLQNHLRLAYAAAEAGVSRFIPADWGSCDAGNPEALKRLQLYRDKMRVRERCEELSREFKTFQWTGIVCGHFFDFGLRDGLLHFDMEKKEALLLDGGNIRASASTLRRIGEAMVAVLRRPETGVNQTIYVQSFNPTQREVLGALQRALGEEGWTVNEAESGSYLDEQQKRVEAGDKHAIEDVVFALGAIDADWTKQPTFAMKALGLEDEDLDEVVKGVAEEFKSGKGKA